jgi:hypothetical protein
MYVCMYMIYDICVIYICMYVYIRYTGIHQRALFAGMGASQDLWLVKRDEAGTHFTCFTILTSTKGAQGLTH